MAAENLYVVIAAVLVVVSTQLYAYITVRRRLARYQRQLQTTSPTTDLLGTVPPSTISAAMTTSGSAVVSGATAHGITDSSIVSATDSPGAREKIVRQGVPEFEWLEWLERRINAAQRNREPVTRESALAELDRILDEDREHVLLQRIGVAAPLVGVLVTAVAFFMFRVPESTSNFAVPPTVTNNATSPRTALTGEPSAESMGSSEAARRATAGEAILTAIRPLASGVCVGAVLAILNQFLLFNLGNRSTILRRQVRIWLEERQEVRGEFVDAATAGALTSNAFDAVRKLYFVAEQQANLTEVYRKSIRQLEDVAKNCHSGTEVLRTEVGDLQDFLHNCRTTMQSLRETVTVVGPKSISAAEGLDGVVKRLDELVQMHLGPAINKQSKLSDVFGNVAENVGTISERIGDVAALSEKSFERFRETWDQHVVPAQKGFQDGASQLSQATDRIAERVNSFATTLDQATSRLGGVADTLDKPVAAFNNAAELIRTLVAENIKSLLESQQFSARQWQQAAGDVAASAQTWKGNVEQSTSSIQQQREVIDTLQRGLQDSLLPTLARVEQAAAKYEQVSNLLTMNIQASQAALEGSTSAIRGVPETTKAAILELQTCAEQFSNAIRGDFASAARDYATLTASLRLTVEETNRNNSAIAASANAFESVAQSQAKAADQTQAASASARVAADALAEGAKLFQKSLENSLLPVHDRLDGVTKGIESTVSVLSKFLTESFKPANDQLLAINHLAQSLQETLSSLRPLADLRQPIERMANQLHYANQAMPSPSSHSGNGNSIMNRVKGFLNFGRNGSPPPPPPASPPTAR